MFSVNEYNRTFHQCILVQFKLNNTKINASHKKESQNLSKKADISRIFPLIFLRQSKKNLAKSKFYKEKGKKPVNQIVTYSN